MVIVRVIAFIGSQSGGFAQRVCAEVGLFLSRITNPRYLGIIGDFPQ
jgi:hypothetical protein